MMKKILQPSKVFLLAFFLIFSQEAIAKNSYPIYPITLLLLSKANNIQQVKIPSSFSWQTSRTVQLEIQVLTTEQDNHEGNEGASNTQAIISIYSDQKGDDSFSQVLAKRPTDETGNLVLALTLPTNSTRLKVTALNTGASTIVSLDRTTSVYVSLNIITSFQEDTGKARELNDL